MTVYQVVVLLITGLLAGLLSGSMGIGGAIIIIPSLVFLLGVSQHEAQGTSLMVFTLPVFLLAVINYAKKGQVNYPFALVLVGSFILGSYTGSKLAGQIPEATLSRIFGILLIVLGIRMVFIK